MFVSKLNLKKIQAFHFRSYYVELRLHQQRLYIPRVTKTTFLQQLSHAEHKEGTDITPRAPLTLLSNARWFRPFMLGMWGGGGGGGGAVTFGTSYIFIKTSRVCHLIQ